MTARRRCGVGQGESSSWIRCRSTGLILARATLPVRSTARDNSPGCADCPVTEEALGSALEATSTLARGIGHLKGEPAELAQAHHALRCGGRRSAPRRANKATVGQPRSQSAITGRHGPSGTDRAGCSRLLSGSPTASRTEITVRIQGDAKCFGPDGTCFAIHSWQELLSSSRPPPSEPRGLSKVVRVRATTDISVLDPGYMTGGVEIDVLRAVVPRLVAYEFEGDKVGWEPTDIVESVSLREAGREFDFTLSRALFGPTASAKSPLTP